MVHEQLLAPLQRADADHIAARHKLAMADAAMYAMAREFDATFWTQDADYQGLDGVRYQPKPGA